MTRQERVDFYYVKRFGRRPTAEERDRLVREFDRLFAVRSWDTLTNGKLLEAIKAAALDVFVTCDQNLRHQQNLSDLPFAIVVIGTTLWPVIAANPRPVVQAVSTAAPGSVATVQYPKPPRGPSLG